MKNKMPRLLLRPEVDENIRNYTALAAGEFGAVTELNPISIGNLMVELHWNEYYSRLKAPGVANGS